MGNCRDRSFWERSFQEDSSLDGTTVACNQFASGSSNLVETSEQMRRALGIAAAIMALPAFVGGYSGGGGGGGKTVAEQVGHELMSLAYYSVFDDLSFRVDGGRVTLSGQVTQPVLKEDAERAVRRIPGVQSVVDQI